MNVFGRKTTSDRTDIAGDPAMRHGGAAPAEPQIDLEELWLPSNAKSRKSVEQLLSERGHVTEEQLTQARQVQSQTPGKSITQILLTMNSVAIVIRNRYRTPSR